MLVNLENNITTNQMLKLIRIANDVKSNEVATHLAISQSFLSQLESGKKQVNFKILEKFANFYNTRPSKIIEFVENANENGLNYQEILKMILEYYVLENPKTRSENKEFIKLYKKGKF